MKEAVSVFKGVCPQRHVSVQLLWLAAYLHGSGAALHSGVPPAAGTMLQGSCGPHKRDIWIFKSHITPPRPRSSGRDLE